MSTSVLDIMQVRISIYVYIENKKNNWSLFGLFMVDIKTIT